MKNDLFGNKIQNSSFSEKIEYSIQLLQKSEKLALKLDPENGFYLAFSGGKDSQCIYHLAKLAGVKFTPHMSITTIDPPELLNFIRKNYLDVIFHRPKNNFYQLIIKHKLLPTRKIRFCCAELKETGGIGKIVVTGNPDSHSKFKDSNEMFDWWISGLSTKSFLKKQNNKLF